MPLQALAQQTPAQILQAEKHLVDTGGTVGDLATDGIQVSKTLLPTGHENLLDIALTVRTTMSVKEIVSRPSIAVVLVMDVSNTMNKAFDNQSSSDEQGGLAASGTRLSAAKEAAQAFVDSYYADYHPA